MVLGVAHGLDMRGHNAVCEQSGRNLATAFFPILFSVRGFAIGEAHMIVKSAPGIARLVIL